MTALSLSLSLSLSLFLSLSLCLEGLYTYFPVTIKKYWISYFNIYENIVLYLFITTLSWH